MTPRSAFARVLVAGTTGGAGGILLSELSVHLPDIWDWNLVTGGFRCSDRWKLMLGLPVNTSVERVEDWYAYVHEDDVESFRATMEHQLAGDSSHFRHEYRLRQVDGGVRWVLARGVVVRDETGCPMRMSGTMTDVTDRRRTAAQLADAGSFELAAGAATPVALRELLDDAAARTRAAGDRAALLLIDLDRLKAIIPSIERAKEGWLLVHLGEPQLAHHRLGEVLARLGDDEFAVLVHGGADSAAPPAGEALQITRYAQVVRNLSTAGA